MGSAMTDVRSYFPEECDTTGGECLGCVWRTAESVRALTGNPTAEWAGAVFQQMYSHAACRQMEYDQNHQADEAGRAFRQFAFDQTGCACGLCRIVLGQIAHQNVGVEPNQARPRRAFAM